LRPHTAALFGLIPDGNLNKQNDEIIQFKIFELDEKIKQFLLEYIVESFYLVRREKIHWTSFFREQFGDVGWLMQ